MSRVILDTGVLVALFNGKDNKCRICKAWFEANNDEWVLPVTVFAEVCGMLRDLPLGGVDASVVAIAERLRIETIATIDRTDFGVVRPKEIAYLNIVP
ncbi:MAG: hypothetical protein LBB58_06100 [Cellulomonadaceae bacterium]|nr:hypothetical protein [Cellulomonadaceae bacterium]